MTSPCSLSSLISENEIEQQMKWGRLRHHISPVSYPKSKNRRKVIVSEQQETVLIGQLLTLKKNPFHCEQEAVRYERRGAIQFRTGNNRCRYGRFGLPSHASDECIDYSDKLLVAGFVDAMCLSANSNCYELGQTVDGLGTATFPEEMRFGDAAYAESRPIPISIWRLRMAQQLCPPPFIQRWGYF